MTEKDRKFLQNGDSKTREETIKLKILSWNFLPWFFAFQRVSINLIGWFILLHDPKKWTKKTFYT